MFVEKKIKPEYLSLRDMFLETLEKNLKQEKFEKEEHELRKELKKRVVDGEL